MTATVIELRQRQARTADPCTLVRLARGGMSREAFAAALSPTLGWSVKPGMIRAWESGVAVPQDVVAACRANASRGICPAGPAAPPEAGELAEAGLPAERDAVTLPCRGLDGRTIWVSIPRRTFLSGGLGAAALTAIAAATGTRSAGAAAVRLHAPAAATADLSPVEHLEKLRHVLVDADNLHGSGRVIPAVQGQIQMIRQLREGCRGSDRQALLGMQAKYAEFAGWLYQDARDFQVAQYWLDRSFEWSCAAGDRELSTFVMARKSQLAGDMSDGTSAVDLATAAAGMARKQSRLKATAAVYGAHGYALAGDRSQCLRMIDRAGEIAENLDDDSPWAAWLDGSYVEVQRARCLSILGDHTCAGGVFQLAIAALPSGFRRDRGVYLAREALAHSAGHEPEQAAGAGMQAVAIAHDTQSGRVADELAQVGAALKPWAAVPAVADFQDALASVLPAERTE